ncbi:FMN-binding protein [Desulfitobacterium hafniense]|uniref:FMN-binding protein n=1 Tax=Desulfitobacterium hafniense TaxID=49338 RepID=UPI0003736C57|nr:FMN-binding protein [Desulfitobacterium hafniense]
MKRTKLLALLCIIISIIFLAAGCGDSADSRLYKDGTYEGVSNKGIQPGLKVAVTIQDDMITEIKVVENKETQGIGTNAIDQLPGKIIEAQSTEVDSVAGASLSSNAIKEAVTLALEQAKK